MKQIHKHLGVLLLLIILAASCGKDAPTSESYEGENFYYFSSEEASVLESSPNQVALVVYYSTQEGGSGKASFSVNTDSSTAILDADFTIVNTMNELTFSSDNGFSDTIFLQTIDNDEFTGGILDVVIELDNTENGIAGFAGPANFRSSITVQIQDDDCPTRNVVGDYISTTTGTSTDPCCPDATSIDGEVTLVEISEGVYEIFDWSVGLYNLWYEVYGISAELVASGGLTTQLSVLCDDVTASFNEPFGTPATIVGKVDLETGIITYTWVNGYADTATVTLTPK